MARMLTEEEVERLEKQRELRERARAATSQEGLMRFREAQERKRQDALYRESHGGLSKAEVQAAGPDGSGRQYRAIARGAELQAARTHEMDRLGRELATREEEALQKRMGMAEQGMEAAKQNKEAAIRAAELQTASAKDIATINKDSAMGVAKINAESNEKINKDRNYASVDVANINKDATVEAATVNANAQAAQQYAQDLMRQRQVDEKTALTYGQSVVAEAQRLVNSTKNKQTGKPTMTLEEAIKQIDEKRKKAGQMTGTQRPLSEFAR